MNHIWCVSGPCGSGKTTLSTALADHLSQLQGGRQVCLLHGDDFHAAFRGNERSDAALPWPEVLRFNWDCLLSCAGHALSRGLDVVIDYIVEEELPLLCQLAAQYGAHLHYAVLTAPAEVIRCRLEERGDAYLTERALFLREKLGAMPENRGYTVESAEMAETLQAVLHLPELLQCNIDNDAGNGVS